jgi:GH24 family phage-related lysozyme (muramidase)
MMARTQITLDRQAHRAARARAAALGISLAEYLRRLVAADLSEPQRKVDASVVFNLGASGGSDVSAHKDQYIAEAIQAKRQA